MSFENNYSSSMEGFEKYRHILGFILGPIAFFLVIFINTPESFIRNAETLLPSSAAHDQILQLAYGTKVNLGLLLLMVIWWVTRTVHIPVTAILPGIILPLFHVTGVYEEKIFQFRERTFYQITRTL